MYVRNLPEIFKPFYEEPDGVLFSTRLGKNRAEAQRLIDSAEEVRSEYLAALQLISGGLPKEPNGSFAYEIILDTAVKVIGEEGASLFAELLSQPWIIENWQLGFILLGGVRLGGRENVPTVQEYCRRIKLEKSGPDPQNILSFAGKVMAACMKRGLTDSGTQAEMPYSVVPTKDSRGYAEKF